MPGAPAREPIEARLARAGLAAAAADGLAGAGSRRAARQPRGPARDRGDRTCGSSRWSRPTPTGTAPSRSRSRSRPPGPTGSRSPRSTRRSSCARPASRCRSWCSTRSRRRAWRTRRAAGIAISVGSGLLAARLLAAAAARKVRRRRRRAPAGRPHRGRDRARPGRRAAGGGRRRPWRRCSRRPASAWRASGRTSRPRTMRANALGQDLAFGRAIAPLVDAVEWGRDATRRHLAGSGGVLGADVARWDSVRTGLVDLRPGARRARAARGDRRAPPRALRPVMSLHARPVRVAELPAGHGVSYGPTFVTARPSPHRDPPRRLRRRLAARPLGPRRGARPRPCASRSWGGWRWTP